MHKGTIEPSPGLSLKVKIELGVYIAFLPGFVDLVSFCDVADQHGRLGVVQLHGLQDSLMVGIGIAVAAEVAAAVVGTDISGDIAGTFLAVSLNGRQDQPAADGIFKYLFRHAAGAVSAGFGKSRIFPAGLDDHVVFCRDPDKCFR